MKFRISILVGIFLIFGTLNSYSLENNINSKDIIIKAEKNIENNKYKEAISILKNIKDKDVFYSKSNLLQVKSYIEIASIHFLESTDRKKNLDLMKYNLNIASSIIKNINKDEKELDRYIALLNLNYSMCFYSIALDQIDDKNYIQAIDNLNKAIKYNSEDSSFYDDLSFCLAKLKKYNEAIKSAKKGLEMNPKKYNAHYSLALIYSMMNDKNKAILELKESIKLSDWLDVKNKAKNDENFINIKKSKEFINLVK